MNDADLGTLETQVERALETGDDAALRVLGYGEISLVLGWPPERPAFAVKRLPPFPSRERYDAYASALDDYVAALGRTGIDVIPSEMRAVERPGRVVAYVVQPACPPGTLAPRVLAASDPAAGHPLVGAIADAAAATVGAGLGLDAQVSNWLWSEGRLRYLDVTTPLIWSDDGRCRLDLALLVRPLPWALRGAVRRFVAPGIVDRYRDRRSVLLDACANLLKERLERWIPGFLEASNARLDRPIGLDEVRRYYRSDARLWEILLRVRRLDRAWQRRVRRRPYPFLLPKEIVR